MGTHVIEPFGRARSSIGFGSRWGLKNGSFAAPPSRARSVQLTSVAQSENWYELSGRSDGPAKGTAFRGAQALSQYGGFLRGRLVRQLLEVLGNRSGGTCIRFWRIAVGTDEIGRQRGSQHRLSRQTSSN